MLKGGAGGGGLDERVEEAELLGGGRHALQSVVAQVQVLQLGL